MESFSLRQARPDELQKLVAIDDEASELYVQAGLEFAFEPNDPFVLAESVRWADAIERGLAQVAVDGRDRTMNDMASFRSRKPRAEQNFALSSGSNALPCPIRVSESPWCTA